MGGDRNAELTHTCMGNRNMENTLSYRYWMKGIQKNPPEEPRESHSHRIGREKCESLYKNIGGKNEKVYTLTQARWTRRRNSTHLHDWGTGKFTHWGTWKSTHSWGRTRN